LNLRLLPLLPLWEKVAIGDRRPPFFDRSPMLCIGYAKSVSDEGLSSRETYPHPSAMLRIAATPPTKGEGKKTLLRRVAAGLAAGFEQEPGRALGFVDKSFEQSRVPESS